MTAKEKSRSDGAPSVARLLAEKILYSLVPIRGIGSWDKTDLHIVVQLP